ncbi:DUF378 domain-containing protein [archaeon]|nr:DUF378 domain-containing protein [archaeon]
MKKTVLDIVVLVLVIIGGINWGLVGISRSWNIVSLLFGSVMWLESLVYILVGLAAIWSIKFLMD